MQLKKTFNCSDYTKLNYAGCFKENIQVYNQNLTI